MIELLLCFLKKFRKFKATSVKLCDYILQQILFRKSGASLTVPYSGCDKESIKVLIAKIGRSGIDPQKLAVVIIFELSYPA